MRKLTLLSLALALLSLTVLATCEEAPPPRTAIPAPDDQKAYEPVPMPKPLPPDPSMQPQPVQNTVGPAPSIRNEDPFLKAYDNRRSPRLMVWVNRTIQGDPLPKDGLEELLRIEKNTNISGAVSTTDFNKTITTSGPTAIQHTTSVKMPADKTDSIGAAPEDYQMIEASIVKYFDNSGKVQIKDSDAARAKLSREQVLRIENSDPAAARLLSSELQQDVLIKVTAVPTNHSQWGKAVRLIAKATSTTDARILGSEFVDMPLPMTKPNINVFTRYLAEELMGDMAKKWLAPPEYDPIEIRIYKVATVDDALKIRKWLQQTKGVVKVDTRGATGGTDTAYGAFGVSYAGAPEDLYGDLKAAIGISQGLKAVDLQNNTISLEMTGQLNLVTTTRSTETKTTVETNTTETKTVEPINPSQPPK